MKNIFDLAIYNRLRGGGEIAAELEASRKQYRKWIAIYKYDSSQIERNISTQLYFILEFELEKDKMNEYLYDEDLIMHNKKKYSVNSEEELIDKLLDLRIDPKKFTYPWKCDYPL